MEALRETIAQRMRAAFDEVTDWDATRARIAADHAALAEAIDAGERDAPQPRSRSTSGGSTRLLHGDNA